MKKSCLFIALLLSGSLPLFGQSKSAEIQETNYLAPPQTQGKVFSIQSADRLLPDIEGAPTPTDTLYDFESGSFPDVFAAYVSGKFMGVSVSANAWSVAQSPNTLNGGFSLRSGAIGDSTATNMGFYTTIGAGGGTLQFDYRVSSEDGYDKFYIQIGDVIVDSASGEVPWTSSPVYTLSSGEQWIDFWYVKDTSQSTGLDKAFVDNISITGQIEPQIYLTDITPKAAAPGTKIALYGKGFNSSTEVTIGGTSATVNSYSDTKVIATVPSTTVGLVTLSTKTDGINVAYNQPFTVLKQQPAYFETPDTLDASFSGNYSLLSADIDHDGDVDLVGSFYESASGTIKTYRILNNGDGSFTSKEIITPNTNMGAGAIGDFDLNGYVDLVYFTTTGSDTLLYLSGNGDGTFATGTPISRSSTKNISEIYRADINHDGYQDIITQLSSNGTISWFAGNGDGTFGTEQFFDAGATYVRDAHFADLDNDGDLDFLVIANNVVKWYRNDGAGNFTLVATLASGFSFYQVTTSDLNNDGNLDIVTGHTTGMGYLINNGNGTFGSQISIYTDNNYSLANISDLKAIDLDGDGDEDFLSSKFYVLKNGPFDYSDPTPLTQKNVHSFVAADFNGDGDVDIINYNNTSKQLSRYENLIPEPLISSITPKGVSPGSNIEIFGKGFSQTPSENTVTINGVAATVLEATGNSSYANRLKVEVPVTAIGKASVSITVDSKSVTVNNMLIVLKNEEVIFSSQKNIYNQPEQPYISVFGDINGDGYDDVVSWSTTHDNLDWFANDKAGAFGSRTPIASSVNIFDLKLFDIDQDGDLDIIVLMSSDRTIKVYPNLGNGLFSTPYNLYNYPSEAGFTPYFVDFELADMDSDGLKDIVVGYTYTTPYPQNQNYKQIVWHKNNGDQTVSERNIITNSTNNAFTNFVIADYDGDGDQDLMFDYQRYLVQLLINDGYGRFSNTRYEANSTTTSNYFYDMEVVDFNQDGIKDLLYSQSYTGNSYNPNISVTQSTGNQLPPTAILNHGSGIARFLKVLDFNGDGQPDILAGYTNEIKLFLTDVGTIIDTISVTSPNEITNLKYLDVADPDNDGDFDIVFASNSNNKIGWYENTGPVIPLTSISDARQAADGEKVHIKGIVTRSAENVKKIQQESAGLHIPSSTTVNQLLYYKDVHEGDSLDIVGEMGSLQGMKQLVNITSVNVLSTGNNLPAPINLDISAVSNFEPYESVLVLANNLSTDSTGQRFINDSTYTLIKNGSPIDVSLSIGPSGQTQLGGTFIPAAFNFEGVISQASNTGTDGYALFPINKTDVTEIVGNRITISEAKTRPDSALVKVTGIVTSPNFDSPNTSFFIQDNGAGIYVFKSGTAKNITVGDRVEVVGQLLTKNALREIEVADIHSDINKLSSGNSLPAPKIITYADYKSAASATSDVQNLQGSLVRINSLITDPNSWPANINASSTNVIANNYEDSTFTFRLWSGTEVMGTTPPQFLDVIGIMSTSNAPQIYPRFNADIIDLGIPAPNKLQATETATGIDLNWYPSIANNIGGYDIYRSTNSFTDSTLATKLNTGMVADTAFSDNTVQQNTRYYYKVVAIDSSNFERSELSEAAVGFFKLKSLLAISSRYVVPGDSISLFGSHFSAIASEMNVTIGDSVLTPAYSTVNTAKIRVPALTPGSYTVSATVQGVKVTLPSPLFVLNNSPEESGYFRDGVQTISNLGGPNKIKAHDVTGDGFEDLIIADAINGIIYFAENKGDGSFASPEEISNGLSSNVAFDFNDMDADGDIDIVISDQGEDVISWVLNDGNGNFDNEQNISLSTGGVSSIRLLDVDNNGTPDVVASAKTDNQLVWFSNQGDSTFAAPIQIAVVASPRHVELGDLNKDGLLDLVVISGINNAYYLLNNGAGFNAPVYISQTSGMSGLVDLAIADLNNDEHPDLIFLSSIDNKLAWLPNNGNNTFSPLTVISDSVSTPINFQVLDVNGDGNLDIAVNYTDNNFYLYSNDGTGSFSPLDKFGTEVGYTKLTYLDVENDGDLDLVTLSQSAGSATLFINSDAPPAAPTNVSVTAGIGTATINWAANTDSDLAGYDVERSSYADSGFAVLNSTLLTNTEYTDSGLQHKKRYYYRVIAVDSSQNRTSSNIIGIDAVSTTIADITPLHGASGSLIRITGVGFSAIISENTVRFNSINAPIVEATANTIIAKVPAGLSGLAKITVSSQGNSSTFSSAFHILNANDATFTPPSSATGFNGTKNMAPSDINGDGNMDLALTQPGLGRAIFYYSDGSNPISSSIVFSGIYSDLVQPINIDSTHAPDFIFASSNNSSIRVLRNNGGGGNSAASFNLTTLNIDLTKVHDMAVADMDNDAVSDIILASNTDNAIRWYKNESTDSVVSFGNSHTVTSFANGVRSIDAGDFNGDGLTDILAVSATSGTITLYSNNGDETFTASTLASGLNNPTKVQGTDINNDGHLDFVAAVFGNNSVIARLYDGNGNFGSMLMLSTDINGVSDVSVADLNGDGLQDILATSQSDHSTYWFMNEGNGSFATAQLIYDQYNQPKAIIPYDFDGDGKLDISVLDQGDNSLYISRNFVLTGLSIQNFAAGTNAIVQLTDTLALDFGVNLNTMNNFMDYITGTISLKNKKGESFTPGNLSIDGSILKIYNLGLYTLDTLSVSLSAELFYQNSQKTTYIDVDGNGEHDTNDDVYTSPDFYTTMIGDFNSDLKVDFNDLVTFGQGWRNADYEYETAPLAFGTSLSFPHARLNGDQDFNIEDLVSFIRYWNLTQYRSAKEQSKTLAAKQQNAREQMTPELRSRAGKVRNLNTKAGMKVDSDQPNLHASEQANSIQFSDSLRYISYRKVKSANTYNGNLNQPKEVTYTFALSHPDSVSALSLIIDYDPEKVSIRHIEDLKLFQELPTSHHVFLSHIDSVNGSTQLNIANFGTLSTITDRGIASLTFRSLNDEDTDIIIRTDIRAKGKPAMVQQAMKSVQVKEDFPTQFELSQNYPNPFNPSTTIHYSLAEQSDITLTIYDVLGRKIETLLHENAVRPGYYKVHWDASRYASGMYIYVIQANAAGHAFSRSKKMMLIK